MRSQHGQLLVSVTCKCLMGEVEMTCRFYSNSPPWTPWEWEVPFSLVSTPLREEILYKWKEAYAEMFTTVISVIVKNQEASQCRKIEHILGCRTPTPQTCEECRYRMIQNSYPIPSEPPPQGSGHAPVSQCEVALPFTRLRRLLSVLIYKREKADMYALILDSLPVLTETHWECLHQGVSIPGPPCSTHPAHSLFWALPVSGTWIIWFDT